MFETVDGSDLDKLVVPGFYTYAGFHDFFLDQLAAVAEKLANEQWVMGEFGEQNAVEEQFARLGPTLLDRYAKDFVDEWNKVLDNVKLKPMSADKPQYIALSAASSPTSPLQAPVRGDPRRDDADTGHRGRRSIAPIRKASRATPRGLPARPHLIIAQRFRDRQGGLAAHRHRPGDQEIAVARRRRLRRLVVGLAPDSRPQCRGAVQGLPHTGGRRGRAGDRSTR